MPKSRSTRYLEEFSELIENILKKKNINKSFGRIVEMSISDPKKASSALSTLFYSHVDPVVIDSIKSNGQLTRIDVLINNWKSENELRELMKKREEERIQSIKDIKTKKKNENLDKTTKYKDKLIGSLIDLMKSNADSLNVFSTTEKVKKLILDHPALADHLSDFMVTRDNMTITLNNIRSNNLCKDPYNLDVLDSLEGLYGIVPDEDFQKRVKCFSMILHNPIYYYMNLESILLKHGNPKIKSLVKSFKQMYDEYEEDKYPNAGRFKIVNFLEQMYALHPDDCKRLYHHLSKQIMVRNYLETRLRFPNNPDIQSILEADYSYFMLYPEVGLFTPEMEEYQQALEEAQRLTNQYKEDCIHPYNPTNAAKVGYLILPNMVNLY